MLSFVYTFQAIVIFLTGIVSLILAKLELFFVNFKKHFQHISIVFFLAISGWSLPHSYDYENFPCCFRDKTQLLCDVLCDCLKLELYRFKKTVVLIKLQKVKQKRQAN